MVSVVEAFGIYCALDVVEMGFLWFKHGLDVACLWVHSDLVM